MSWNDIYKKWGLSEQAITGLNTITWLAFVAASIIGGLLILAAIGKGIQCAKATDPKDKERHKKEMWFKLGFAILCFLIGAIWPTILGIMDAFGVGKITSGEFLPKTFNLIYEIGV